MAAEKKDEADREIATAAPSGGGGNKLVLILTGVNTLVTLAMLGVLFVSFQKEQKTPAIEDLATNSPAHAAGAEGEGAKEGGTAKPASNFGKMVTLELFTVNLATPGSVTPKFVRVNISLEVPNDDSENEVNLKMPQVRNVVIDLFNSKRPADLATAEGRDYLKEEIRNALNAFLVTGKVKGVFFTNFALSS